MSVTVSGYFSPLILLFPVHVLLSVCCIATWAVVIAVDRQADADLYLLHLAPRVAILGEASKRRMTPLEAYIRIIRSRPFIPPTPSARYNA